MNVLGGLGPKPDRMGQGLEGSRLASLLLADHIAGLIANTETRLTVCRNLFNDIYIPPGEDLKDPTPRNKIRWLIRRSGARCVGAEYHPTGDVIFDKL